MKLVTAIILSSFLSIAYSEGNYYLQLFKIQLFLNKNYFLLAGHKVDFIAP